MFTASTQEAFKQQKSLYVFWPFIEAKLFETDLKVQMFENNTDMFSV